jgi:anti-sigma factor RsiW
MNEHVNGWLTAYFDGQLGERRSQKVREHLKECASCRKELAGLENLRHLLGENPAASGLLPAQQFASQVAMRLTRRPSRSLSQRTIRAVWGSIPAVLLTIWAIAQAMFILITISGTVANLGLWGRGLVIADQSPAVNALLLNLGVSGLVGILLMSWLASWWIRRQGHMGRRATE